jgi:DnaK suppressor protein
MTIKPKLKQVILPQGYLPTESEPYMNEFQIEFFRNKLYNTRQILQEEWENLNNEIHSSGDTDSELSDKASREIILFSSIKRLSSIQNSINEIDDSIESMERKKYGFCKKTGQKIGINRLLASPEAKFCVETQEFFEEQI